MNPSQHVERIREILIGRDLQHMHGRLSRIEGFIEEEPEAGPTNLLQTISKIRDEQAALRQEIQSLKDQNRLTPVSKAASGYLSNRNETSTSLVDSQIDARYRDIITYVEGEILKMKDTVRQNLSEFDATKADRTELTSRFARLASAAMEEQENQKIAVEDQTEDGFLLPSTNF